MRSRIKLLLIAITAVMVFPMYASAATLDVVGGRLMGASGVDVGGALYDVQFVKGSCVSVFGGCDDLSDFTFSTMLHGSYDALFALRTQVIVDGPLGNFRSSPWLVNGGIGRDSPWSSVTFQTPDGLYNTTLENVVTSTIWNVTSLEIVGVEDAYYGFAGSWDPVEWDLSEVPGLVWAKWTRTTSVPEPSTLLLLGSGLAGIACIRLRFKA